MQSQVDLLPLAIDMDVQPLKLIPPIERHLKALFNQGFEHAVRDLFRESPGCHIRGRRRQFGRCAIIPSVNKATPTPVMTRTGVAVGASSRNAKNSTIGETITSKAANPSTPTRRCNLRTDAALLSNYATDAQHTACW